MRFRNKHIVHAWIFDRDAIPFIGGKKCLSQRIGPIDTQMKRMKLDSISHHKLMKKIKSNASH